MAVLTSAMETAVARLRATFDPEEIILFGSRAYGAPRPDSDMDLLIILRPTTEPMEARRRRARAAMCMEDFRTVDGQVWPYTVEEMREQLHRGSRPVRDALAKGTRLHPEGGVSRYRGFAGEWSVTGAKETLMGKARDDFDTAELLLASARVRRNQWWVVAFHAQQAAEKALKALIYHLGSEPPRTHSLSDLVFRVVELDRAVGRWLPLKYQAAMADLERYAVEPRYEDESLVGEPEARVAVETARGVLDAVAGILGA